jgi:hypothetical protein
VEGEEGWLRGAAEKAHVMAAGVGSDGLDMASIWGKRSQARIYISSFQPTGIWITHTSRAT